MGFQTQHNQQITSKMGSMIQDIGGQLDDFTEIGAQASANTQNQQQYLSSQINQGPVTMAGSTTLHHTYSTKQSMDTGSNIAQKNTNSQEDDYVQQMMKANNQKSGLGFNHQNVNPHNDQIKVIRAERKSKKKGKKNIKVQGYNESEIQMQDKQEELEK